MCASGTYKTVNTGRKSTKIYPAWSDIDWVRTLMVAAETKMASSGKDRAFLMMENEDEKKESDSIKQHNAL